MDGSSAEKRSLNVCYEGYGGGQKSARTGRSESRVFDP